MGFSFKLKKNIRSERVDLMAYTSSHLNDYVTNLLQGINIFHPSQLNIEYVASRLNKRINYLPYPSMCIDGEIFLDSRSSKQVQWQEFAHELCHARLHDGDQALISAMQKDGQEHKAENFAQLFCIPTFMLNKMKFTEYDRDHVWRIEETFMVEKQFAQKRWEQHIRNLISV